MSFSETLISPLLYVVDPEKRLFFGYLLPTLLLGFTVLYWQKRNVWSSLEGLFHPKVWLHRSTKIDFQLLVLNTFLKTSLFVFVSLSSVGVAKAVLRTLNSFFPYQDPLDWTFSTVVLAYTVMSFVAIDFFRFFQHYLFHKIPFLWQFHKIHHSAEVMTPVTLYRTHPVESLVSAIRQILVLGLISGVFLFYTRSLITAYAIVGVNALDFVFNFLGSNLRHSHVWINFGPLNRIFVSPAQHQVHHSRAERHFDKNMGFALSIWDQLFGTYYGTGSKEFLIFGVRGEKYRHLGDALIAPWRGGRILRFLAKTRNFDSLAAAPTALRARQQGLRDL